jgi:hypothetical protein
MEEEWWVGVSRDSPLSSSHGLKDDPTVLVDFIVEYKRVVRRVWLRSICIGRQEADCSDYEIVIQRFALLTSVQ